MVLEGVDLFIFVGSFCVILGESGVGKLILVDLVVWFFDL